MAQDHGALGLGPRDGRVDGAVVDDEDVETGGLALDVADHAADHPLLVVGGDDGQQTQFSDGLRKACGRSSGAAERLHQAIKGTARTWDSAGRASLTATMPPVVRSDVAAFDRLDREITGCRACPRLVAWREAVAADPPKRFRGQDYWARPVPGFGDRRASIVLIGLAPAANGANRTGRMFTGDRSGDWLYAALFRAGLANQPRSIDSGDGLELAGAYVTAAVRCAPPANKPTTAERDRCRPFLDRELALLPNARVIVALGSFGWAAALRTLAGGGRIVPARSRSSAMAPRPRSAS